MLRIIAMRSQPVVRAAAAGLKHTAAVPRQPTLVVPLVGRLDASRARASHTTPNPAANKPSEPEKSAASAVDPNTPPAAAATDTAATATVAATGSRAKLRQLVVQYGTLAMVTHVVLSLCSLGGTYALVAAGLDTAQIIEWLHIPASKTSTAAGTFALAYVIHKATMPLRLPITVIAVPIVARIMRRTKR